LSGRATPSQTVGPFYSIGFSWLERADLTRGMDAGRKVTIRGRVLDGDKQAVPDCVLEIWQADCYGRYAHPEDAPELLAPNQFWGFGRVPVDDQGEFCFSTIQPGSVPGPEGTKQAPHLIVSIFMRGLLRRLVTRIYFPEEPLNDSDVVLARVPEFRRGTLIATRDSSDKQMLHWDVHLQGDQETVFFDC
jgi:protocatechuate 3,4-dioxygenase, alpha subunit